MWELALTLVVGSVCAAAFYALWASHGFWRSPHPEDRSHHHH